MEVVLALFMLASSPHRYATDIEISVEPVGAGLSREEASSANSNQKL